MNSRSKISPETRPVPPCQYACPVHTDTRRYVELIARGDYQGALDVILQVNPFASVCGYICHHPCELECRRCERDGGVGLRALKRFVADEMPTTYRPPRPPAPARNQRVVVVGAGPAGLAAAHDLALDGFRVTVLDRANRPGGMLALAIPPHRLPEKALQRDLGYIQSVGVEVRTNVPVGESPTIQQLREEYDAVVLAVGLSLSRGLNIPGFDGEGVLLALPFLMGVRQKKPLPIGKDVLVVGGGNVAVDVAACAVRLGAERVRMVCLESPEEMPAWDWELREIQEEGVTFINSRGPMAVERKDGRVTALKTNRCTRVFDEQGRFAPQFDDSDVQEIEADTIIFAIGQQSDPLFLKDSGLETDERGRLVLQSSGYRTSADNVFACGEVVRGPGSAIEAVRDGQIAAQFAGAYLKGEPEPHITAPEEKVNPWPEWVLPKLPEMPRKVDKIAPAEVRKRSFDIYEQPLTEEEALLEAHRCMACAGGPEFDLDKCARCLTCARVCPTDAIKLTPDPVVDFDACIACGLCASECPAYAIRIVRFPEDRVRAMASRAKEVAGAADFALAFLCSAPRPVPDYRVERGEQIDGLVVVRAYLPCSSTLAADELLLPFELGAKAVWVLTCPEGVCPASDAERRFGSHVRRAADICRELRMPEAALQTTVCPTGEEKQVIESLAAKLLQEPEQSTDE